jgi:hypothetical protein
MREVRPIPSSGDNQVTHSADVRITVASLDKPPMVALRERAKAAGLDVETEETTHTKQGDPDFGKPVYIVRMAGDVVSVLTGEFVGIDVTHRCGRVTQRLWWAM